MWMTPHLFLYVTATSLAAFLAISPLSATIIPIDWPEEQTEVNVWTRLYYYYKNRPTPASFLVYFWSFQTNIITIFTTNICEKMSIHFTVPGFEPTAFIT